jgi:TolA-binding protein
MGVIMRILRSLPILALAVPLVCEAQNKQLLEIQRTLAQFEESINRLKQSQDERLIELKLLVQQALESSNKASTNVTILEGQMRDRLNEQQKSLAAPVAGIGTRMEALADEFRFVRESITDLNAKLGRLETKLVDVENAVKMMQAPPPPPPGSGGASSGPPPGVSADALFKDGYRDKLGGRNDLALQQLQDYVRWFPDTDNACQAQYFIGDIYYSKGDHDKAVQAFDTLLEKMPENCARVPDAHYQKGLALAKLGQKTSAAEEFRELKRKHPTGQWATKANAELKALGFSTTTPPATRKKTK